MPVSNVGVVIDIPVLVENSGYTLDHFVPLQGSVHVGVEMGVSTFETTTVVNLSVWLYIYVRPTAFLSAVGRAVTLPGPQTNMFSYCNIWVPGDWVWDIELDTSSNGFEDFPLIGGTIEEDPPPIDLEVDVEEWEEVGGGIWRDMISPITGAALFSAEVPDGTTVYLEAWGFNEDDYVAEGPMSSQFGEGSADLIVPMVMDGHYCIRVFSIGSPRAATARLLWAPPSDEFPPFPIQLTVRGMSPTGTYMWNPDVSANVPYLTTTPHVMYFDIANGPFNGAVNVFLDNRVTMEHFYLGDQELDEKGTAVGASIPAVSIPAGTYDVSIVDIDRPFNQVTYSMLLIEHDPFPTTNLPTNPSDIIYPAPADTIKWQLHDTTPGDEDTFTFIVNPNQMRSIDATNRFTMETTVLGRRLLWQKAPVAIDWGFSGRITHKAQYLALKRFTDKDVPFWLTDQFGRSFSVTFQNFDFVPDPATPNYPWLGKYTITAYILDGPVSL